MRTIELQDIIDSIDIVEYIGQYIDLEEQNNEHVGLCPFHSEATPSLTITSETQLFYCFGCGAGGSVLTFIQKYNKCSMREAISLLKNYANITEDTETTVRLNAAKTIKKYKQNKRAKERSSHKVLNDNIVDQYENDRTKLKIWNDEGISYDVLEKYKVRYDPFSDRLVYPIKDINGNIICMKGRTLNPEWKQLKLRKYTYFQSVGDLDLFFGYYEHIEDIVNKKEIIIFEGEKSVMLLETWGITNSVAMLTSHLNPLQLLILIKLGVKVVFALDKNVNILKDENIQKLKRYVKIEYTYDSNNVLGEKDAPVDKGIEVWNKLYSKRRVLR